MSLGRVLIVDDEPDVVEFLVRRLREAGFDCRLCRSAKDAHAALEEAEYDFALIDDDLGAVNTEIRDGEELYAQLERKYPGLELQIFTAKPEKSRPPQGRVFEVLKYDAKAENTEVFVRAVLKGVNSGLRKKLEWQSRVVSSARLRFAVLDEQGNVVWENDSEGKRTIKGFIENQVRKRKDSSLFKALTEKKEQDKENEDNFECQDGTWYDWEIHPLPDEDPLEPGKSKYRLLTTKNQTRQMTAAKLAQDLLQRNSFEEIAELICEGLLDLGFSRARLWILQGDNRTLTLYKVKGHGELSQDDLAKCQTDFRKNSHLNRLLSTPNSDAEIVHNPADYLQEDVRNILNIRNTWPTLGIPLWVRDELIGMLTVDKGGPPTGVFSIAFRDKLIGKQIGRLAAAALDRGIHEWQFQRVQEILSQTQHKLPDEKLDEIYRPVFYKIFSSLGNDPAAPWLSRFQGAEIAVRWSRLSRGGPFHRVGVTPKEQDVLPPTVDITQGLIGEVMSEVMKNKADERSVGPRFFRNIFKNARFKQQFNELFAEKGQGDSYVQYLQQNQSKTMIPLLDLDKEILGFLCFHAPCTYPPEGDDHDDNRITKLHRRWLVVLGHLCSRILEVRERHHQSVEVVKSQAETIVSKEAMVKFGEINTGVIHEAKKYFQRLLFITEDARVAVKASEPSEVILEHLADIDRAVDAGDEELTELQDMFMGMSKNGTGSVSVKMAIQQSLALMAQHTRVANVKITQVIPDDLPPIPMALVFSLTVFPNLIRNACEAIREANRHSGYIDIIAAVSPDGLLVTIKDNGAGISPDNLDNLFRVGFTTKPRKSGMGVGLSLVRRVIEDHGGRIWADSVVGEGSVFHVLFNPKAVVEDIT